MAKKKIFYYIMAIIVVCVWGCTFVSTKILLDSFTSAEIMLGRFLLAYFALVIIEPKFHKVKNWKDEIWFFVACLTGVTLYFFAENTALELSSASNVSVLVTTAPIFTAVAAHFFIKGEKISKNILLGLLIALVGVVLVVFNGSFILKLNIWGDLLAISAALLWTVYSLVIKKFEGKYSDILITRKIFFYGIITTIPFIVFGEHSDLSQLWDWSNMLNFLFLGLVASSACFVAWNKVIWQLGTVKTTNFIYCVPLVTMLASSIVLNESITCLACIGAVLIVGGVWLSGKTGKMKMLVDNEKN